MLLPLPVAAALADTAIEDIVVGIAEDMTEVMEGMAAVVPIAIESVDEPEEGIMTESVEDA